MSLLEIKKEYFDVVKQINKGEYSQTMQKAFLMLREFSELLKDSYIRGIEIDVDGVYMTDNSGIRYVVNFDDCACLPLQYLSIGMVEPREMEMVLKIIKDGDIVFDIGANYGQYSLAVASKYPKCLVYAFEPMPITMGYLRRNIKLNDFENIRTFLNGFYDENTVVEFYFYKDSSGGTSIGNLFDRNDAQMVQSNVRKIDSFLSEDLEIDRLDFIKMDIEGAELLALKGGYNALDKFKPAVFVEMLRKWSAKFGYTPNDTMAYMADMGYLCFELSGAGLSLFEHMTEDTISTNFFFLHKEKHSDIIGRVVLT